MPIKIVTAAERLAQPLSVKGIIAGPSGSGKTTLAKTLPAEDTLFVDFEAGMSALAGDKSKGETPWEGDSIDVRLTAKELGINTWDFTRHLACVLTGPDPSKYDTQHYSNAHFQYASSLIGGPETFAKYNTIFVDSITVAGRHCFNWCKAQPAAFNKNGQPDTRGAYGLQGQEMVSWITQTQHTPNKSVWMVGILDEKMDEYNQKVWQFQLDGSATGLALPGIFDQVMTLAELATDDGLKYRALVTKSINPWGFPAKDRSGRLDLIEQPSLGLIMDKLRNGTRQDAHTTAIPDGVNSIPNQYQPGGPTLEQVVETVYGPADTPF